MSRPEVIREALAANYRPTSPRLHAALDELTALTNELAAKDRALSSLRDVTSTRYDGCRWRRSCARSANGAWLPERGAAGRAISTSAATGAIAPRNS